MRQPCAILCMQGGQGQGMVVQKVIGQATVV